MNNKRATLVYGFWAQNIGNAFFNLGGRWVLQQVFGEQQVSVVRDQPGYRTFYDQSKGNPANDFGLLSHLDTDYVVLQGPVMTKNMESLWGPAFENYKRAGTKVLLLGAAFFKYTDEEISAVRRFFDRYGPVAISTRDSVSYDIVKDWGMPTHDGIDSAFFAPEVVRPFKLDIGDYCTLNFDRFPEPDIELDGQNASSADHSFEWGGHQWALREPRLQRWFSHKGKAWAYIGHRLDMRNLPTTVAGMPVIRPEHRYAPHMTWKIYKDANAIVSDEPYTYLSVYAGTKLTLADRVHACVATLAYGNPAMLFTPSPRQALFARLGLEDIRKRPVSLDMDYLQKQKDAVVAFVDDVVNGAGQK